MLCLGLSLDVLDNACFNLLKVFSLLKMLYQFSRQIYVKTGKMYYQLQFDVSSYRL